ncbi:family 16 glycosylhydrolase [Deinococcus hohokamensis]|uniref:Family 16 glycosylhydrolase n=1 Tax=Deinococcus hohokamensis TaxID=309883 RepID=A0ABV9I8D0_9DEIO
MQWVNTVKTLGFALMMTLSGAQTQSSAPTRWTESFDRLDTSTWAVSNWNGFWQNDEVKGAFDTRNAYTDGQGHLVLKLDVRACAQGLCAQAAEIQTHRRFGFGRYSVRMRAASSSARANTPGQSRPGNISGAFSFFNNSATEIDVEIEGHRTGYMNAATWTSLKNKDAALVPAPKRTDLARDFHTYTWDWQPQRLAFSIDGVQVWETRQHVPQQPGHLMLNVWPTMNPHWGGEVKPGQVYMLVDSVSYEPS